MIKEYERVKTLVDKEGFMIKSVIPAGSIGTIVSLYQNGAGCEVEIWDETGYPIDVVTYRSDEVEVIPSID